MNQKNSTVFVICEYNPFHFGHQYQISTLKKRFDRVMCIMSGNLVQRGEIAVYSKYARAEAAIRCGADGVFELPFPYSFMAAPDFAFGGAWAASALGCEALAFGCEDEVSELIRCAGVFPESTELSAYLKSRKNLSYPKAVCEILKEKIPDLGCDLSRPNNILGVEYIRAFARLGKKVEFTGVKRDFSHESSSAIRKSGNMLERIPKEAAAVLEKSPGLRGELLDKAVLTSVILASENQEIYGVDKSEFLRIKKAALSAATVSEAVDKSVSATMTAAKVRRALICTLFGIKKSDNKIIPPYIRLLGVNQKGRDYIAKHKKSFSVPVISKKSHVPEEGIGHFEREETVNSVISLALENKPSQLEKVFVM